MRSLLILTFILTSSIISAQTKAKILAEGIISTGKDYCTTFSPDGKTIYFARTDPETKKDNIMESRLENGNWTNPVKVSFSTIHDDTDPMLSPDGKIMYFMTRRTAHSDELLKEWDIWYVEKTASGWGKPVDMGSKINDKEAREGFPVLTYSNKFYFFSAKSGGYGSHDIYVADYFNGKYLNVRNLGPTINTEYYDTHAYVDPDETIMIHYRNDPGTFGRGDLYVRYRQNGSWSQAINLGPNVNTDISEITPYLSHDKKTLYFSRVDREGARNIYYIDVKNTTMSIQ